MSTVNEVQIEKTPTDFFELSDNFEQESVRIVDSEVYNNKKSTTQISKEIEKFAEKFTKYASSKDPNFGLLYIFGDSKSIKVKNYLKKEAKINNKEVQGKNIHIVNKVSLNIGDEEITKHLKNRAGIFEGIGETDLSGEVINIVISDIFYTVELGDTQSLSIISLECTDTDNDGKEDKCLVKTKKE